MENTHGVVRSVKENVHVWVYSYSSKCGGRFSVKEIRASPRSLSVYSPVVLQ